MANGIPGVDAPPGGAPPQQNIPGLNPEEVEGVANSEEGPVLEALQTIQTFIATQQEKGNPGAEAMAKTLLSLIQSIGGNATENEQKAPGQPGPMPVGPGGPSAIPENSAPGSRPVMPSL